MTYGLIYGKRISEFYLFKLSHDKGNATDEQYYRIFEEFKKFGDVLTITNSFKNKHRHTKFLILKSKYLELLLEHNEHFNRHIGNELIDKPNDIKKNISFTLNEIEDVFKKNIFMDEALEYYLEERVKYVKYELIDLIKGVQVWN